MDLVAYLCLGGIGIVAVLVLGCICRHLEDINRRLTAIERHLADDDGAGDSAAADWWMTGGSPPWEK
jgi:hypothetical protein